MLAVESIACRNGASKAVVGRQQSGAAFCDGMSSGQPLPPGLLGASAADERFEQIAPPRGARSAGRADRLEAARRLVGLPEPELQQPERGARPSL